MEVKPCNGLENFISDAGILSFVLGTVSGMFGLFTLGLSLINQLQTNISAYFNGFPTAVLTLLGPDAPPSLVKLWAWIGVVDVFAVISTFAPLGDFINFTDYIGNGIGILGILVSVFATFPEVMQNVASIALGVNLQKLFDGYGCQANLDLGLNRIAHLRQEQYYYRY